MFCRNSLFVIIVSDAECLTDILELNKICFSEGICKVGFPNNSLSKYMKIMYDMGIPYVVSKFKLILCMCCDKILKNNNIKLNNNL